MECTQKYRETRCHYYKQPNIAILFLSTLQLCTENNHIPLLSPYGECCTLFILWLPFFCALPSFALPCTQLDMYVRHRFRCPFHCNRIFSHFKTKKHCYFTVRHRLEIVYSRDFLWRISFSGLLWMKIAFFSYSVGYSIQMFIVCRIESHLKSVRNLRAFRALM